MLRPIVRGISEEAMQALRAYRWPGNVRELRNAIERAVLLSRNSVLGPEDFALGGPRPTDNGEFEIVLPETGVTLERVEEQLVRQALAQTGGNQSDTDAHQDNTDHRMDRAIPQEI